MQGLIEISDPWDFPQLGKIPVTILAGTRRECLVRFETPIAYRGHTYAAARLNPRHEGGEFAPATSPLPVNVALLHDPIDAWNQSEAPDHVFVIGVFRFEPTDCSAI